MAPYTGFSHQQGGTRILDELDLLQEHEILPPGPVPLPPQPPEHDAFDMTAIIQQAVAQSGGTSEACSVTLRLLGGVNESSLQRFGLCLPNLRELTLDGSPLGSLRELGSGMGRLRVLRVSRCALASLDGLWGLPALRELSAAHNPAIKDVWSCAALPKLHTLDLAFSGVQRASHVGFLTACERLRSLTLLGSPAATPSYRSEVHRLLPQLDTLDGRAISQHEPDSGVSPDEDSPSSEEEPRPVLQDSSHQSHVEETEGSSSQEAPRRTRPASASVENTTRPREQHSSRRAMSARPRSATEHAIAGGSVLQSTGESPSLLTSGGVLVSGSLAAALRHLQQRGEQCWTEERAGVEVAAEDPLLAAVRQWRSNYTSFTQTNRERWRTQNDEGQQREASEEVHSTKPSKENPKPPHQ